ncbi:MAG: sugar phosphate isomerase/epimerase [Thermomicrobiales bacterium]
MQLSFILPRQLATQPDAALAKWIHETGFNAVDTEAEWTAESIDILHNAGIGLGPLRVRASLAEFDEATCNTAVVDACVALDAAKSLGIATVWTLTRNFRNDRSQRENFAAALTSLPQVVDHAEQLGIRIGIENCPYSGQNPVCTPESWDALFRAIPSSNLGICFDPSHCIWQRIDIARVIREYGDRFVHLHAKDTEIIGDSLFRFGVEGPQLGTTDPEEGWSKHGWWRHRLPGLGAVDWNAFVTAMVDRAYVVSLTIEHEDPVWSGTPERIKRGLERSRTYLSSLIP